VRLYRIALPATPLNIPARYNIAPTQRVPIVRRIRDREERELVILRWGLVPFWAKDAKVGYSLINARAETIDRKPSFRTAFKQRRCLVAADGFYEWMATGGGRKQPHFITLPDDQPFAFAGLWESWVGKEGKRIESCVIVVCEATEPLRAIHDRMPVILPPERFDEWLDVARPLEAASALLRPYRGPLLVYPVSNRVNSPQNDDVSFIERGVALANSVTTS
jgi:putative SOS response-associated peptidase YedK